MRYIKLFEAIDPPSMNNLFDKSNKLKYPTKEDILKIKSVINDLVYILEDEGFRHISSFENTDVPSFLICKKSVYGHKSPGPDWTPTDSNRYFYPKKHTFSDDIMEFINRLDEELDGFKIKIHDFTQSIAIDIIKQ